MSLQQPQRSKRTPKVKQACDCCHARKIKCDGTSPCNNCQIAVLQCTYLSVPKKKGPKGPSKRTPRAILKMQMEQQKNNRPETSSVAPHMSPSMSSSHSSPPLDGIRSVDYPGSQFEPSPLLSASLVRRFAESYFKHKYPLMPIIHRGDFYANTLPTFRSCPENYALVASLCAAVLTQVIHDQEAASSPEPTPFTPPTDFFISEARRARTVRDYVEKPTLRDVQSSFFIFAGLFDCDRHNSAWFHLREAITLMEALRLHEEVTYDGMDAREALFSRRTFWLLFITERAYALQRHRPLSLNCTIGLPTTSPDDPDAEIISGFLDLVALFQNFNHNFVSTWNNTSRVPTSPFSSAQAASVSAAQLAALQATLAQPAPEISKRTEIQEADFSITRIWLSTMTWQLCVAKGLLSSSPATSPSLSFRYPISLAASLAAVSAPLHREAFDANGPGILEKIFDIGCSLTDVLLLQQPAAGGPAVAPRMQFGPRDHLNEMLRVMNMAMGGSSKYLAMLSEKAAEALRTGPRASICGPAGLPHAEQGRIVEVVDEEEGEEGEGGVEDETAGVETVVFEGRERVDGSKYYGDGSSAWTGDVVDAGADGGAGADADADTTEMFGFGALGDASIAWLASLDPAYPASEGETGHVPRPRSMSGLGSGSMSGSIPMSIPMSTQEGGYYQVD